MNHWLLDGISGKRDAVLEIADKVASQQHADADYSELAVVATTLEIVVLDLAADKSEGGHDVNLEEMRACAIDASRLLRVLPLPDDPLAAGRQLLRRYALAILGNGRASIFGEIDYPNFQLESKDSRKRMWSIVIDIWLSLLAKQRREWHSGIEVIKDLLEQEERYEKSAIEEIESNYNKAQSFELIGLYHLVAAAEVLFAMDGSTEGSYLGQEKYEVHQQQTLYYVEPSRNDGKLLYLGLPQYIEMHFDKALDVCEHAKLIEFEPIARLLSAVSSYMVENKLKH